MDKEFRLTCPDCTPVIYEGTELRVQMAHLDSADERALLELMPVGTTYVDADGDAWERIA